MDRVTLRRWTPAALGAILLAALAAKAQGSAEGLAWHARALAIGMAGGFAGGLVAGAIGLIAIPLIVFGLGLPLHQAAATNLVQTAATASVGAWRHHRRALLDLRRAAIVLVGSLGGAPLGSWTALRVPVAALAYLFVAALLAAAAAMAWRSFRPLNKTGPRPVTPAAGIAKGVLLGIGLGFASGLLGVGAGFLVTPSLAGVLGLPVHVAVGTGLAVIAGNSALASLPHVAGRQVHWLAAAFLAVGGSIGVRLGAFVGRRTDERILRVTMSVVLVVAAWSLLP